MGLIAVGASLPLELQLHDGDTGKFPLAYVYDQAGSAVTGSPFTLTHLANGLYRNTSYTVLLANQKLVATFITYNEVGHTTESVFHTRATEQWNVETQVETVNAKLGTPASASVSADIAAVKSDTGTINTKIGTPVGTVSSDIAGIQTKLGTPAGVSVSADIAAVQTKLGTPAGVSVSADISSIKGDTTTLTGRLTAGRANNLDNLDATVSSRSTQSSVDAIQNNTRFVGVVPSVLVLPTAGSKNYKFYANLFDEIGNPEDPDSNTMNIRIEKTDGTVVVATTAMTRTAVGRYEYPYTVNSTDTEQGLVVFYEYAENTVSFQQVRVTEVQEFESKLDTLLTRLSPTRATNLDNLDTTVSSRLATTAFDTKIGSPAGASVSVDIAAIKAETASIQADTNDIQSKIGTPLTTLAGDISSVQADTDALQIAVAVVNADTDDIQAKIGLPVVTLAADIAAVKAETASIQADTNDIQVKIGAPVGTLASDIAGVQSDTNDIQSKIGSPVVTVAADIAAVKAETASIQADTNDIQSKIGSPVGTVSSDIASVKADSVGIKAKTDQLNFTGTNVNANSQVVSDKTGYALTVLDKEAISDIVWDEILADHTLPGSTGEALGAVTPADIADAVWNDLVASHALPGTFGLYIDVIRQYGADANAELTSGFHGLSVLKADIAATDLDLKTEINQNETKIDAIIPAIISARNTVIAEVDQNQLLIGAVSTQLSSVESTLAGEINQNETKLDEINSKVGTIQNNTTVRFVVPDRLIKPTSGSKTYEFRLYLYDEVGNPEAPDTAPLIRIRRLDTGFDLISGAAMTQDGVKVGAYYYQYTITSGTAEAQLLVETTVVEGGVTRYYPAMSEITEFESDLNAIQSQLSAVQGDVIATKSDVQNPIYGLNALKNNQVSIVGEINQNETLLNLIKGKTDLIPANIATQADVAAVGAAVLTRPDIVAIQTRLDLLRDNIKGLDGRDITQVYDKWDISSLAKTADPRFANLDAAISSRSTLTAAQVWNYSSRILTAYGLDTPAIDAIWAYLTSQATTPNSIGKRIADFLDVAISTRSTAVQVTAALAGVAQESTVNALSGTVVTEANQNELKLNQVLLDTAAIKAKTGNLPSDPASQSLVQNTKTTLQSDLANLDLKTSGIKAKTDNLPVDPAKETSVQARPTNPVLSTDPRIGRLDVPVSSRGTVMASDLVPLAKTTDITTAKAQIIGEIDQNETKLNNLQGTANLIKAKTDLIPSVPASKAHIDTSETHILNAISGIPVGGGGATPAQIWSYGSRTLTQDPATFGPDISGLAEKSDLIPLAKVQYINRMTTTFNNLTNKQEILAWAEQDGQRILGENCTVTVKDHLGATVWTGTLASPSSDGIFRFENTMAATGDSNYYVEIDIVVDGDLKKSRQTFVTVG